MAERVIKHASFWYVNTQGINQTALRGDTVDIPGEDDLERGERLDAFATDADLKPGTVFGDFYAARQANRKAAADAGMPALADPAGQPPAGDRPGDGDSRAKWVEYARGQGAPDAELAQVNEGGLTRDALREKYGA